MSDLQALQNRAIEIQQKYRLLNSQNGHGVWDVSAYTQGLVGDVGDLMKLIMARENLRSADDIDHKISHELSDCLWSILVIASELHIDLSDAFNRNMNDLEERISGAMG